MPDDKNTPASGFKYRPYEFEAGRTRRRRSPSPSPTAPGANSPRTSPASTSPRASRPRSPSAPSRWRSTAWSPTSPIRSRTDAKIEFVTRDDPRALELIRHDCAHVLAEAVQELWPGTQVTIGPVIENGFYYDFARNEPFTPEDFAGDREEDARDHRARQALHQGSLGARRRPSRSSATRARPSRSSWSTPFPATRTVKIYHQGDWFDLCRGPHMTSTGKIGNAFKLMKVAGAYWRGDTNNPMLTRIYGTAFAKQEELDAYLKQLEEAEKRDHRKLGREMDLFHFQEEGPGVVFWHAKGWTHVPGADLLHAPPPRPATTRRSTRRRCSTSRCGRPPATGAGTARTCSRRSRPAFRPRPSDKRFFALKPMNCPGHVQIFKHGLKSYRDLPIRLAEFGTVHRYEPSGALHGLMRVRGFTQDDAHIFCTEEQLAAECLKINDLILSIYADFGFDDELR